MLQDKTVQRKIWGGFWSVLAAGALLLCAGQAIAQQEGYGQEGQQQQQERQGQEGYQAEPMETDFSDEKIEKFARAYMQIQEIQQEYSEALGEMTDEQEAQELQEKYTQQMVDVVRDEGLSVEDYNQIGQAMNTDDELRQEIEALVDELQ